MRTPGRSIIGRLALGRCVKAGATASCCFGSASHVCMPCKRRATRLSSMDVRSECTMPRPAVIQLTSPGAMLCTLPTLSRCRMLPSNRYVTVASPICGCGRTSMPLPGANSAGPIWSKNMKGPTILSGKPGSSRLTSKSPRSLVWGFNTAEMPAVIAASCITCGVCAGKPCCRRIPLPADGCWRAQTKRPRERPFREAKRARVSRRQRAWVSPVARAFSVRRPGSVRSRACRRGSPRLPPRCCSSCWC